MSSEVTNLAQHNSFLTQENQQLCERLNETPIRRSPRRLGTTVPESFTPGAQPKKSASTFERLMQAQQASVVVTANDGRNKRERISDLILIMHEEKLLQNVQNEKVKFENCWAPMSLPVPTKDKKLFQQTMSLVDFVITPAQRKILKEKNVNREKLTQTTLAIECAAMEKLRELEEIGGKNKREIGSYTAMGNRMKKLKN
jgi:hypothetical protein